MEFHLPFLALRKSSMPLEDKRQWKNGKPLRRSWDLNFLSLDSSDGAAPQFEDCIHEAQVSCIVTGFDERSWIAIAFIDTYYDGENSLESVECHAQKTEASIQGDSRVLMDPFTLGETNADRPIWKPREYFLRILECRIRQIRFEWQNVVERVLQLTQPYVRPPLVNS